MAQSLNELHSILSHYARMSYSRDHERQSDEIGFELMVRADYDPRACAGMWKGLVEEEFSFFASPHPATSERIETLSDLAKKAAGAPAEAFRSVGLMRWRRGEKDMAREYFRRYLAKNPEAGDREIIRNYLAGA